MATRWARVRCLPARFLLPQRRDDLLFRVSLLRHRTLLVLVTEENAALAYLYFPLVQLLGFGSE